MTFEYNEIRDKIFISDCVCVHKSIFQLSDIDCFPPTFFTMLIRKEHPLGIVIGCFKKENNKMKLIGLAVTIADIRDHSLYCVLVGVLPEYQNGRHGYMFALKLRELALKRGLTRVYGIYDPMEANLGKLYSYIGGITTMYINEAYTLSTLESDVDKVLYEWQLDSEHVKRKLNRDHNISFQNLVSQYSVVQYLDTIQESEFLLEVPNNYLELKAINAEEANRWQVNTKTLLSEYLNHRGYHISECLSGNINGSKKTYYLLSNKLKNEILNRPVHSNN
jgi:predicted GNAT superfamily acetyltransferase